MNKMIAVVALAALAVPSHASSPWAGRLDLDTPPAIGAWQSLTSADQAVGLSKRVFHIDNGPQEVFRAGLFAGVSKPALSEPAAPLRPLGGATFAVPGAVLDWALGTKWGDAWLPKLKTGLLGAYDITRVNRLHIAPSFVGVGVAYPIGGGS